jgi:hypothetical protein
LPKSVLVFVYSKYYKSNDGEESSAAVLHNQLNVLRTRGREIKLFYSNTHLQVFEIVNEPEQSRVIDLIF